jgi:phosphate-selective porin OprO/OprP
MKGKTALMAGVAAIALVATVGAADAKKKHAAESSDTYVATSASASKGPSNADLAARVQALEDALAADEARDQADHNRLSALDQDFHDTQWTFDNARPTIKSGDGRFTMAFRVRFQGDFAGFMQDATHGGVAVGTSHGGAPVPGSIPWAGGGKFDDLSSGAVFRRAYLGVEGRAFKDFWYELRFNAGGSDGGTNGATEGDPLLNKAVITYTGIDHFHVNVGVIEPNFMFEGTTSSASLTFLERPEIDNIAADTYGAGDSRRGIEMNWQKTDTLWAGDNVNMTVAYTGGKTASLAGHNNGGDEQAQLLGRISDRLWTDGVSNLQIGASGADAIYSGGVNANGGGVLRLRDRPEVRVDGTRLIDTTNITAKHGYMYAFDAGMNFENFFVGGEYAKFEVDRAAGATTVNPGALGTGCTLNGGGPSSTCPHPKDHPSFSGWYVEGSWFITGETRQYAASALNNEVGGWQGPSAIASPFSLDGDSWGAWELAARYSYTDLDWHKGIVQDNFNASAQAGIPGGRESIVDIALNWYLNRNIRLMMDDLIVHVTRQNAPGVLGDSYGGQFSQSPFGSSSPWSVAPQGQDLNVVGVRLQFAN